MRVVIEFSVDNVALEAAGIAQDATDWLADVCPPRPGDSTPLFDSKANHVGEVRVTRCGESQ